MISGCRSIALCRCIGNAFSILCISEPLCFQQAVSQAVDVLSADLSRYHSLYDDHRFSTVGDAVGYHDADFDDRQMGDAADRFADFLGCRGIFYAVYLYSLRVRRYRDDPVFCGDFCHYRMGGTDLRNSGSGGSRSIWLLRWLIKGVNCDISMISLVFLLISWSFRYRSFLFNGFSPMTLLSSLLLYPLIWLMMAFRWAYVSLLIWDRCVYLSLMLSILCIGLTNDFVSCEDPDRSIPFAYIHVKSVYFTYGSR